MSVLEESRGALAHWVTAEPLRDGPVRLCMACLEPFARPWARSVGIALHRCASCRTIFAADVPEATGPLYDEDYFAGVAYSDYAAEEATLKRNFAERVEELAGWKEGGRLLEIGCSMGFFLDLCRGRFRASGLEISAHAAAVAKARGHEVVVGDLLGTEGLPRGLDVVALWDVLEHLPAPEEALCKISGLLAPGGLVALTTPDAGSLMARFRGRRWRMVHPPTHLTLFSRPGLRQTLLRAGLRPVVMRAVGCSRSVGTVAIRLLGRHGPGARRFAAALAAGPVGKLGFRWNMFDIVLVLARKV